MSPAFSQRVEHIKISGIRRFFNLVQQYPNALSLTIGQPDLPTPLHIKSAAKDAIDAGFTGYTTNAGILPLRTAAAQYVSRYGLRYDGKSEVIVTNGSTEGIAMAFHAILDAGDEVILPGPVYPGYEPLIRLCGAIPIHIETRDTGFRLHPRRILEAVTHRTRCVVLPYPSNPTGVQLEYEEMAELAEVLKKLDVFIVSDEVYSELVYDKPHTSIAAFEGMRDKTIVVNGLSKSHAMTGWRIGLTFAPADITAQMLKVHQYLTSCASSISQKAALEALTEGITDAVAMRAEYSQRRDFVYHRLTQMGLEPVHPGGAFYIFPSVEKFGLSSEAFAHKLLSEAGVAVVPGNAFSEMGEGYVRISYAVSMEILKEALHRMENFLRKL
ncbi:aminotransferase A [Alicyclobacillus sp. SO9]|uniref:aminotransferase A n=1 Tax=Alicyclobacillus sp. SO9 TaxID=2665646 RepID=UPI0018E89167|nr:aminotransferase A [Alicyclobacillus sp. SO9]QQE78813.1 aminotransferase A [Alicyclobacillus sp. SO9]